MQKLHKTSQLIKRVSKYHSILGLMNEASLQHCGYFFHSLLLLSTPEPIPLQSLTSVLHITKPMVTFCLIVAMVWMFVSHQNSCWILTSKGVWEAIRSWGWSPHEWNQCPYEIGPRELIHPFATWGHSENVLSMKKETGALTRHWICWCLGSCTSPPPELWESNLCCL